MGLNGVAAVFAAVLTLDHAAIEVGHAVLLAALLLQVAGWDDAHVNRLQMLLHILKERFARFGDQYAHVVEMQGNGLGHDIFENGVKAHAFGIG